MLRDPRPVAVREELLQVGGSPSPAGDGKAGSAFAHHLRIANLTKMSLERIRDHLAVREAAGVPWLLHHIQRAGDQAAHFGVRRMERMAAEVEDSPVQLECAG